MKIHTHLKILAFSVLLPAASPYLAQAHSLTVCSISADKSRAYDGRTVSVSGYVKAVSLEYGIYLYDKKCPNIQILLHYNLNNSSNESLKALNDEIFHHPPFGTTFKSIRGNFVGAVSYSGDTAQIDLQSASDLVVRPEPTRDHQ